MQAKAAMTSSSVTVTASLLIDHVGRLRVGRVTFHPSAMRASAASCAMSVVLMSKGPMAVR